MSKTINNTILQDTSELIRGLEALAYPSHEWSRDNGTNRYSALRLCYHLMTRDGVSYDGKVRAKNAMLMESAFEGIAKNLDKSLSDRLRERLNPITLETEQESKLTHKSINDAANYFQDCVDGLLSDFRKGGPFGGGLSNIEKYLFKPVQIQLPPQDALADLLEDKQVTGRRFYAAIYQHEKVLSKVKHWVENGKFSADEYGLFFTLFRIKLSEYKSIYLTQENMLEDCHYEPDSLRGEILSRIPQEHGQEPNYHRLLEEGMYTVWLGKQNQHILQMSGFEIPSILNVALQQNDKAKFLEKVLDFSQSDFKEQYNKAIEIISKVKVRNMDEFRKNLHAGLYSARGREMFLSDNNNWVFISDGQELADFCMNNVKIMAEDMVTEGSITGIIGALARIGVKAFGKGVRGATSVYKSFGNEILTMTKDNRNIKIDQIFE
ncbi:hypothetical protein [Roseivirga sp. UBA1976]|uniref:hypothetical protein n=1 Tax=Roseivirga sp. UBA1976 TaxID=1947386 RepID=UPI00257E8367|nr:hypothetical protein [Roseivirga sp. UBA1976]